MTITIPTIDDFKEETVMTVIRKVVDYLIEQLVPEINDNDVTNASLSISGDTVTMRLTMGDGTSKSSSVSLSKYATDADLNALEDEFNALAPQLSISGKTLTIQINGKSSSVVLPSGDTPIATDTTVGSVKGGTYVNIGNDGSINNRTGYIEDDTSNPNIINNYVYNNNLKMYTNNPIQKVEDVTPQIVNGNTLRVEVNGISGEVTLPSGGDVNGLSMNANGKVDVSASDTGVNYQLNSSGNNMTLVGNVVVGSTNNAIYNDTATIINSVSGSVSDGKLTIIVNGVSSGDIPLPKLDKIYYGYSSSDIEYSISKNNITSEASVAYSKNNVKTVLGINNICFYASPTSVSDVQIVEQTDEITNYNFVIKAGTYSISALRNFAIYDLDKNRIKKYKLNNVYVIADFVGTTTKGRITNIIIDENSMEISFENDIPANTAPSSSNFIISALATENTTVEEII